MVSEGHDPGRAPDVALQPLPALEPDELTRLRTLLGPPDPGGDASRSPRPVREAVVELQGDVPFVLDDIERKLDKLLGNEAVLEQLIDQVRQLSDQVASLERALTARKLRVRSS